MKKYLISLVFAFFSLGTFAFNKEDFSFSLEPLMGLKNTRLDEYVFYKDSIYPTDKLSELNWEIKNEFFMGTNITGNWKNFFIQTGFTFAIPKNGGNMKDSDWRNIYLPNQWWNLYKTNYSEHDLKLNHDFSFNFKTYYEFQLKEKFSIKPAFLFDYKDTKATAKGGTCWYGNGIYDEENKPIFWYPYNDPSNSEIFNMSGDNVSYRRASYILWLGSDFSFSPSEQVEIGAGFFFSPYTYALSYDTHFQRNLKFADLTIGYFAAFKSNLNIAYKITKKHAVSLSADFFRMKTIRGKSYTKPAENSHYSTDNSSESGAGERSFALTLAYKVKLL